MLLNFDNGDPFATGMAPYRYDKIQGGDDTHRILVSVEVEENWNEAILDTGGQYFFCTPELAKQIAASEKEKIGKRIIRLKGVDVHGSLCRVEITLTGYEGHSLTLQVTAFLPDEDQEFEPEFLPYPYLGMFGCMERIRFAVDPSQNEERIYFGECG